MASKKVASSKKKQSVESNKPSKLKSAAKSKAPLRRAGPQLGSAQQTYLSTNYQLQPAYADPSGGVSSVPFLLPPTQVSSASTYGQAIEVDISMVYGPAALPSGASCQLGSGTDFTLSWGADPIYAGGLVAQVFIPAYAWSAAAADRQKLQASFAGLLQALEGLESKQCLITGGASAIAQRAAEAIPAPISEVLYYRYGFNSANAYVDIQAGMRLRVESAVFEYAAPNSTLNGFVGSSVAHYDVVGYINPSGIARLAFDAFLGSIRPPNVLSPTNVAGGIIDFQGNQLARRYYRLFYPPNFSSSSQGNTSTANNVMLIGANTLADLTAATTAYLQNQSCAPGATSVLCNLFRGRAIAIPEILVYLADQTVNFPPGTQPTVGAQPVYVPVGTTVRNLIERRFNWIFTQAYPESKISLMRPYRQISRNAAPPKPSNYNTVQFNQSTAPVTRPDNYDAPLVKGDVLSFTNNI